MIYLKYRNQYTDEIEEYKIQTGIDPFQRYKETDSESEKEEIEKWLFTLIRSKNTIPKVEISDMEIQKDLIALSEVDSHEVYHDNQYFFNPQGNLTCKEFMWDKMNRVSKSGARSIEQIFNDDYQLMRVVKKALTYSKDESVLFHWLQINGSGYGNNFRPASAKAIYELFGKKDDCRVLDSSAGWGARMCGAHFAQNVSEYFAVDPNTAPECNKLKELLDTSMFNTNTKKTILQIGSEDLPVSDFREYFDLYFSSPPYFSTEKYSYDPTQSWVKFPKYEQWIKGFYQQTIYNVCDMLKKDGIFILNIFEKITEIKKITSLFLANRGWYIYKTDKYLLRTMPGTAKKMEDGSYRERDRKTGSNYEPVWYAKHYTQLLKEGLINEELAQRFEKRVVL